MGNAEYMGLIKPTTAGRGAGYALFVNLACPLRIQVMVSHAWDETYDDFLGALASSGDVGPFWVCATALYQPEDIPEMSLARQLGAEAGGPLVTVLNNASAVLCVVTPTTNVFTRLWCLFEMFTAVEMRREVRVAKMQRIAT